MVASFPAMLTGFLLNVALATPSFSVHDSRQVDSGQKLANAFTSMLSECQFIAIAHRGTDSTVAEQALIQSALLEQPAEFWESLPWAYEQRYFLKHKGLKLVLVYFSDPSARNGFLDLVSIFTANPRADTDLCITVAHLFSVRHHNFFSQRSTCLSPANHLVLLYSGGSDVGRPWQMKAFSLHFRCPGANSNCMRVSRTVEKTGLLLYSSIMLDSRAGRSNFHGVPVALSSTNPTDDPEEQMNGDPRHKLKYARDGGMPLYELSNFINFTIYLQDYGGR